MGPGKGDTMVWCRVTRHSRVFRGLISCQRDPWDLGRHIFQKLGFEKVILSNHPFINIVFPKIMISRLIVYESNWFYLYIILLEQKNLKNNY